MRELYEDTEFDSSLNDFDSYFMWKTKQKQDLKNRILADIEKLESSESNKNHVISNKNRRISLTDKLAYSCIALTIFLSLFIGSAFISPVMAELISKLPFLGTDNHNVIQLEKHPSQTKAYLNLVSAYNKGDFEAYLQAFSKDLPADSKEQLEKDFKTSRVEKHQIGARLEFIYSNKNESILLSNETHSFDSDVSYQLDSYIVLKKENNEWKVSEKVPFKKVGKGKYGSKDDFDNTLEIKREIEETYHIKLDK